MEFSLPSTPTSSTWGFTDYCDQIQNILYSSNGQVEELNHAIARLDSLLAQAKVRQAWQRTVEESMARTDSNSGRMKRISTYFRFIGSLTATGDRHIREALRDADFKVSVITGMTWTVQELRDLDTSMLQAVHRSGTNLLQHDKFACVLYRQDVLATIRLLFDDDKVETQQWKQDYLNYQSEMLDIKFARQKRSYGDSNAVEHGPETEGHRTKKLKIHQINNRDSRSETLTMANTTSSADDSTPSSRPEGDVYEIKKGVLLEYLTQHRERVLVARLTNPYFQSQSFLSIWVDRVMGVDLGTHASSEQIWPPPNPVDKI
ncbi:hypothetical protein EDB80DRAFT_738494 [Ilyonectria destructans]|nr:hypothetical protein EDB80DRAFT_738494 [Ilyonectria destructans]